MTLYMFCYYDDNKTNNFYVIKILSKNFDFLIK